MLLFTATSEKGDASSEWMSVYVSKCVVCVCVCVLEREREREKNESFAIFALVFFICHAV